MSNLLIWPILLLLFFSTLTIIFSRLRMTQVMFAVAGSIASVIASIVIMYFVVTDGTMVMQLGPWKAPFGITMVADKFSAVMILISNILGACCIFYSIFEIKEPRVKFGFYPLIMVLLVGVNGALLTGDLFNLYVWFEVLLISSFSLLSLGSTKSQLKGALPYVVINLFSSTLFLIGIGAIYGVTGTLNLAELSVRMQEIPSSGLISSIAVIILVALGIKAAIFPLFFWLPVSYHTPPVTISAIFAGLLTKVAVYSMIRLFTLIFIREEMILDILLIIAGFTMVIGVLGAAAQSEIRKILSFHIVSQIGYMIMGLALFTPLAMAGTLFFIIHNIIVKSNLFLISGVVYRLTGTFKLKDHGGLYRLQPLLSMLFLVSSFSLAGLPPLSGFWGKLILVAAGLEVGEYIIVGISLAVGLLTLFSMSKIWLQTFWKPSPKETQSKDVSITGYLIPITILALISFLPALYPEPLFVFFTEAGNEMMNPSLYTEAVLGSGGDL